MLFAPFQPLTHLACWQAGPFRR